MKSCQLIGIVIAAAVALWHGTVQAQSIPFPWQPPRTSPFEPPKADDRTFVVDIGPRDANNQPTGVDSIMPSRQQIANGQTVTEAGRVCTERVTVGPTQIRIPITRAVGPVNPDGTLQNVDEMVRYGVISRFAKLRMMAWDVDWEIEPGESLNFIAANGAEIIDKGILPERNWVTFNGVPIYRTGTASPFMFGQNNKFVLNEFDIPIELVKFPAQAALGENPVPAENVLTIEWDVANIGHYVDHPFHDDPGLDNFWCALIDWVALSFQATSPIILIHGNNSEGGFFDRQGFTSVLEGWRVPYDGCGRCRNPIDGENLPTDTIRLNALRLNYLIPATVRSFGVDSAHLVVHSKGGLDSRTFLSAYYPLHRQKFRILSYTSLGTPHNGSLLADLNIDAWMAGQVGRVEYDNFPQTVADAIDLIGGEPDRGQLNLTTPFVAQFNLHNLDVLPDDILYHTVAADMDQNGNGAIDLDAEYHELLVEAGRVARFYSSLSDQVRRAIDTMYRILRNSRQIIITTREETSLLGGTRTVTILTGVDTPAPVGNDSLVTIPSGQGQGGFAGKVAHTIVFTGAEGKNHASVADAQVAVQALQWILDAEVERGDLRPLWTPAP
jgi:hypothetical protein